MENGVLDYGRPVVFVDTSIVEASRDPQSEPFARLLPVHLSFATCTLCRSRSLCLSLSLSLSLALCVYLCVQEGFNYSAGAAQGHGPDWWLLEVSGIPYGLFGEMLEEGNPRWGWQVAQPLRGMVFGCAHAHGVVWGLAVDVLLPCLDLLFFFILHVLCFPSSSSSCSL